MTLTLASDTHLGSYEIESLLGAGGMGEVYRARDKRLNGTVAIKVLPHDTVADPDRWSRPAPCRRRTRPRRTTIRISSRCTTSCTRGASTSS